MPSNLRRDHPRGVVCGVIWRVPMKLAEIDQCMNRQFATLFCSCDLDLDPMTFIYEHDPYSLEVHGTCKYELPT